MNENNPIISSVITKAAQAKQEKGLNKYGVEVKTSSPPRRNGTDH